MSTRAVAIRKGRTSMGPHRPFIIYQFERGNWSWCSVDSPIAHDLRASNMIYPSIGARALAWEVVAPKKVRS